MTDEELVRGILSAWDLLSPHRPLGAATVDKVLSPNAWGTDRLLFTLQCVLVCYQMHRKVVEANDKAWMDSGMSWTSTSPQQQFDAHPLVGTESERERSTLAWMREAYSQQMATLGTHTIAPDGAAEQRAWMEKLDQEAGESADEADGFSDNQFHDSTGDGLLSSDALAAYEGQLERAGVGKAGRSGVARVGSSGRRMIAQGYRDLMRSLSAGRLQEPSIDDGFDDSAFDQPFIGDSDGVQDQESSSGSSATVP